MKKRGKGIDRIEFVSLGVALGVGICALMLAVFNPVAAKKAEPETHFEAETRAAAEAPQKTHIVEAVTVKETETEAEETSVEETEAPEEDYIEWYEPVEEDILMDEWYEEPEAEAYMEDGWCYINEPNQWNSTYMGVHCITATGSAQYQWLQSHDWGYTDEGICCYDGRILVALTPAFGTIGDYVDLLLADGSVLPVIICDEKANAGTWGHWGDGGLNVIELIVSRDWYDGHENKWYPDVIAWR